MNNFIAMGRLTKDPTINTSANGTMIARYDIAVDRRRKVEGQPDADFFTCNSFGKQAEFVERYLKKGTKVVVRGRVENNNYTNKEGQKIYGTRIAVEDIEFAESRRAAEGSATPVSSAPAAAAPAAAVPEAQPDGFVKIPDGADEQLPFL